MKRVPSSARRFLPTRDGSVRLVLLLALMVFVTLRWRCVGVPLDRDEGEYAYIAQRMLAGELPYRDIFDLKPPGVFFVYLLPVALFGTSVAAIHMALYIWTAATAYPLFRVTSDVVGPPAAAWAVLVFALITIDPAWLATAANTEQFMLLPLTASVWCALRAMRSNRRSWWMAAGATAMAACLFKQVAATQIGFLAALTAWYGWRWRRGWRQITVDAAVFVAGATAVFVPVLAFFALRRGFAAFVDCLWSQNVAYATALPWAEGRLELIVQLENQRDTLWLPALLAAVALVNWSRRGRGAAAFHAGWLAFSAAGVCIGFYFRHHYFIQLAPALASTAGTGIAWLLSLLPAQVSAVARWTGIAAAAGLVVAPPLYADRAFFFRSTPAQQARMIYGTNPFAENDALAELIRGHTGVSDRVLIFGSEPQILFQAGRRSATRYIIFYPLMMDLPGTYDRQREAVEQIRAADPKCIVVTNLAYSLQMTEQTPTLLKDRVERMLGRRFQLAGLRETTMSGTRIVADAAEAQRVREAERRDPRRVHADMLVFVRN